MHCVVLGGGVGVKVSNPAIWGGGGGKLDWGYAILTSIQAAKILSRIIWFLDRDSGI